MTERPKGCLCGCTEVTRHPAGSISHGGTRVTYTQVQCARCGTILYTYGLFGFVQDGEVLSRPDVWAETNVSDTKG